jgi:hypothetical protein
VKPRVSRGARHVAQTGVLEFLPALHRTLLREVGRSAEERVPNYEIRPLSRAIQAAAPYFTTGSRPALTMIARASGVFMAASSDRAVPTFALFTAIAAA